MKHGDVEFHQEKSLILDTLSEEGLRIARENQWSGLIIEMATTDRRFSGPPTRVRCCLRNTDGDPEVDEPSAAMLDAAMRLHEIFVRVGTPLSGARIEWVDDKGDGTVRRKCSYRYV